jgi:hypothetical protein
MNNILRTIRGVIEEKIKRLKFEELKRPRIKMKEMKKM